MRRISAQFESSVEVGWAAEVNGARERETGLAEVSNSIYRWIADWHRTQQHGREHLPNTAMLASFASIGYSSD
jgi:hypothetical protein